MSPRYFVAIDSKGVPVYQRTSLRAKPYVAAGAGGTFTATLNRNYPLRVVEVPKAIRWTARATLSNGSKWLLESKASGYHHGNYAALYRESWETYRDGKMLPQVHLRQGIGTFKNREDFDRWAAAHSGPPNSFRVEFIADGLAEITVHNWPTPGDSICLAVAS